MVDPECDSVIRAEMELLRADVRADRFRLEELLDEDFREIGASGRVWEREELIAALVAAPQFDVVVAGVDAQRVSDRVILVRYTSETEERTVIRTSLWRHSEVGWRCVFHQGTVVPRERQP